MFNGLVLSTRCQRHIIHLSRILCCLDHLTIMYKLEHRLQSVSTFGIWGLAGYESLRWTLTLPLLLSRNKLLNCRIFLLRCSESQTLYCTTIQPCRLCFSCQRRAFKASSEWAVRCKQRARWVWSSTDWRENRREAREMSLGVDGCIDWSISGVSDAQKKAEDRKNRASNGPGGS